MRVLVTNLGDTALARTLVDIVLRAVPTGTTTGGPIDVVNVTKPMRLRPGKGRAVPLKFLYPTADGTYNLVASVDSTGVVTESSEANNDATTAAPVRIAPPFVDLLPTVGPPSRGGFVVGGRSNVPVTIVNNGNVPARGLITIELLVSTDALGTATTTLGSITRPINVRNGRAKTIRIPVLFPTTLGAGSYFVITNVDTTNAIEESDDTNNSATSSVAFQAA
jgi:subtilase family serine protease